MGVRLEAHQEEEGATGGREMERAVRTGCHPNTVSIVD